MNSKFPVDGGFLLDKNTMTAAFRRQDKINFLYFIYDIYQEL
jgi:hypothetical protein